MDGDRAVPGRGPSSREITAPIRDTSNPQPRQEPHSALYHFSPTVSSRQHHTTSERSNRSWNQRYLFAVVSRNAAILEDRSALLAQIGTPSTPKPRKGENSLECSRFPGSCLTCVYANRDGGT